MFGRVNPNASLAPTKGHIHHGALEGHQCGKGFYLVLTHIHAVANTCVCVGGVWVVCVCRWCVGGVCVGGVWVVCVCRWCVGGE